MTPEQAEYHRAMLMVGLGDRFEKWFGEALEAEDPLSDLTLSLCDCISDVNAVIRILGEYVLDHTVNEQVVCDLIVADMRMRYASGEMSRADVVTTLYTITRALGKYWEEPWDALMVMSYDLELYEEGLISEAVFNQSFDAWFDGGERLDPWALQEEALQQKGKLKWWQKLFRK